jgi:hypothetical protein
LEIGTNSEIIKNFLIGSNFEIGTNSEIFQIVEMGTIHEIDKNFGNWHKIGSIFFLIRKTFRQKKTLSCPHAPKELNKIILKIYLTKKFQLDQIMVEPNQTESRLFLTAKKFRLWRNLRFFRFFFQFFSIFFRN